MSTAFTRIDARFLQSKCKYGLIAPHPVPDPETEQHWKKLKIYTTGIKSQNWKPFFMYNVICDHPDCIDKKGWDYRVSATSFKQRHWRQKHPNDFDIKLKVVSYWKFAENVPNDDTTKITKCIKEYRLISKNTLEYINPNNDVHINIIDAEDASRNLYQESMNNNDGGVCRNVMETRIDLYETDDETNVHGLVVDTANGSDQSMDLFDNTMDEDDDIHGLVIDTMRGNARNENSNIVENQINDNSISDIYTDANHNKERNIKKRQYKDTESDSHSSLPTKKRKIHQPSISSNGECLLNILDQMQKAVIRLNKVQRDLEETQNKFSAMEHTVNKLETVQIELEQTKQEFNEMRTAFNSLKSECAATQSQQNTINVVNEMDTKRSELQSKHLKDYVSNEGKNIWSLEEVKCDEDEEDTYILQCKLCALSKHIDISKNIECTAKIQPQYADGQIISFIEAYNEKYFIKKFKAMRKHTKTCKIHQAALNIMNGDLELCKENLLLKSECAYFLFSRAEPDILFHQLLSLLFRISQIRGCELDIGSYGHSKAMAKVDSRFL